jgi:RimJ/RimL family protein N-acetyltransferase
MKYNQYNQPIGESLPSFKGADLPQAISMTGRFCRLEKLDPERHAKALFDVLCDPQYDANWTYLPYGPFQKFDVFYELIEQQSKMSDPLFFSIIDNKTNSAVGITSYLRIEPNSAVIEVGNIHFSAQLQKTPHATEAMFLMMQYVFDTLGYRRYEWKCDDLNGPSKSAAERLGFCFEGVFQQATVYKNRNRDTAWFAITDKQWPSIKQGFISWLASENFDQQQRQRKALQMFRS